MNLVELCRYPIQLFYNKKPLQAVSIRHFKESIKVTRILLHCSVGPVVNDSLGYHDERATSALANERLITLPILSTVTFSISSAGIFISVAHWPISSAMR